MDISIIKIDFDTLKPKDVFKWLEEFGFKRYGVRYYVDPSKRNDPRYPAERDESPADWYTHLPVTANCYDKTMFIIDIETFKTIRNAFEKHFKEEP